MTVDPSADDFYPPFAQEYQELAPVDEHGAAIIKPGELLLGLTEGEPLLREMEEEGQMPPKSCSRVQCLRVANSGHTFRPLWAQKLAHEAPGQTLQATALVHEAYVRLVDTEQEQRWENRRHFFAAAAVRVVISTTCLPGLSGSGPMTQTSF